jgi:hypothetical protein
MHGQHDHSPPDRRVVNDAAHMTPRNATAGASEIILLGQPGTARPKWQHPFRARIPGTLTDVPDHIGA